MLHAGATGALLDIEKIPTASRHHLLAAAAFLVDAYLAAAGQSRSDPVVSLMHDLAAMAVARRAALQDRGSRDVR